MGIGFGFKVWAELFAKLFDEGSDLGPLSSCMGPGASLVVRGGNVFNKLLLVNDGAAQIRSDQTKFTQLKLWHAQ